MIFRILAISFAAAACAGLWFGYMNLNIFRGTPLFDFRYVIFAVFSFLGLSILEWAIGWIKMKFSESENEH